MEARILLSTYPNDGRQLKRLITALLKKGLASCIQRVNYVKSYYLREGKIQKNEEKILLIKTTADKQEQLASFYKKMHPYDLPELIRLTPDQIDNAYLQWLIDPSNSPT